MSDSWVENARRSLLDLRCRRSGWGYRDSGEPSVEPTALACLGLMAQCREGRAEGVAAEVVRAAEWLATLQRPDGSLGISATLPNPGWTTAYGMLLWANLDGFSGPRERAARWLLGRAGNAYPLPAPELRTVGHDTSLVGWPWIADTHSWLEPTAFSVLALRRAGLGDHPRVREGSRLILDRAIAQGGWNYGNNVAFGRELRAQPAPTGLALLALAGHDAPAGVVGRAFDYLRGMLPETRALQSLCWGVLGLRAWGCRPSVVEDWLSEACERAIRRRDSAPRLAYLLLAAGGRSLELLGVPDKGDDRNEG